MRLLRALLLVLVLVNLLLFAAAKGWLGGGSGGEPERLADQIDAQKIVIVQAGADTPEPKAVEAATPPAAKDPAPAAKAEAAPPAASIEACRRYAELPKDKATRIAALAREAKLKVVQKAQEEPSSWWVHIASQPNREEVDKRIAELRAAGISEFFVVQEPGPNHFAISLGLFKLEKMALDLRDKLRAKGVTQAKVSGRDSATAKATVEVRGTGDQLDALAGQLASALPGLAAKNCPAPGTP
jgi:cell division septation protein DedD